MIQSAADVVKAIGGPRAVGRDLGISAAAVSRWSELGLPWSRLPWIRKRLQEKGHRVSERRLQGYSRIEQSRQAAA